MRHWIIIMASALILLIAVTLALGAPGSGSERKLLLDKGWAIQSSAQLQAGGEAISSTGFKPDKWYPATVPSTVVGTLVENGVYRDPFFGMNLRKMPGVSYPIGANFSNLDMPAASPFKKAWWYRKEFTVSKREGAHVWLNFDGINFRASIWLNGKRIADSRQVAGAYRTYEFDITGGIVWDKTNVLALEIFSQEVNDLGITWVDWNPTPPDKNMGIWRDAYLTFTDGPVAMRYPQVTTKVDTPALDRARVTVTAELRNLTDKAVAPVLKGQIETISFSQKVELGPNEAKLATFSPEQFSQLNVAKPRLWWPTKVGPQNLYDLDLQVEANGKVSDRDSVRFGIREITSELNSKDYRVFKVNGKPILIRGGGWAPDMFLRPNAEREIAEIRYVKDMNLNTIRFEGKTESNRFLDLCDKEGILVIAGWCCCDHWEKWAKWDEEDNRVSADSLRDQLRRIRNHPSILTWWYGSDNPPPEKVEQKYIDVLKTYDWPNPYQSSAMAKETPAGITGLRMTGPYEYVPPVYWYVDTKHGGAYSFNTETGPGPAVPPIESLRKMLPAEHLWPIDEFWNFHAGGGAFKDIHVFTEALNARFGTATGVEDYVRKAQVMAYDGQRAMFEAYARNKYTSTGVIQWMMNNSWPSMIWHLYDYYLRPAGGYFGTKKACELLHIQYSYDDRSVVVVNSYYQGMKGLKASAKVLNLDMTEKFSQQAQLDAAPDSSKRVLTLPVIQGLSPTYFVKLLLEDSAGKLVSSNFYWLSTKPETLNEAKSTWYYTPTQDYADYKALSTLPAVELKASAGMKTQGVEDVARVTVENPSKSLAFFVRLKIQKGISGDEVLPVLWEDNYFSLLPGEKRELTATVEVQNWQSADPVLVVEGWNVTSKSLPIAR